MQTTGAQEVFEGVFEGGYHFRFLFAIVSRGDIGVKCSLRRQELSSTEQRAQPFIAKGSDGPRERRGIKSRNEPRKHVHRVMRTKDKHRRGLHHRNGTPPRTPSPGPPTLANSTAPNTAIAVCPEKTRSVETP